MSDFQHLHIPLRAEGLNDLLDAKQRHPRSKRHYNKLKRQWANTVKLCAEAQGFLVYGPAHYTWLLVEPNRYRDPGNVISGAIKFVEDGLIKAGAMPGDGWK